MTTTIIVLRTASPHPDCRTIRFFADNVPQLLVGDTFILPIIDHLDYAKVVKRHWRGPVLIVISEVSHFVIEDLAKQSTIVPCSLDDYNFRRIDWNQLFPGD